MDHKALGEFGCECEVCTCNNCQCKFRQSCECGCGTHQLLRIADAQKECNAIIASMRGDQGVQMISPSSLYMGLQWQLLDAAYQLYAAYKRAIDESTCEITDDVQEKFNKGLVALSVTHNLEECRTYLEEWRTYLEECARHSS